ncbi:MAG: DUF4350 domain-containing protein [Planctomycetaceae bacterium]
MEHQRHLRTDLTWSAVLILLLVGHFWFPQFGTGRGHDSYSIDAEGKKAFYRLVQADPEGHNHSTRRNTDPLARVLNPHTFSSRMREPVLCLLGPARYPNAAEWDALLKWVSSGGRLIVAARDAKPEFAIEDLGVKVVRLRNEFDADSDQIDTNLIHRGHIVWKSRARIVATARSRSRLSARNSTQVVSCDHGSGVVVVVATDFPFSNEAIAYADYSNAVLALRMLEAAGHAEDNEFIFDESLNASGTPKAVGLLLNPLFKPLSVQMLMGVVLFCWWRSRRFGPLLPPQTVARRNIVDHTDSVGLLLFRAGDGTTALRAYLRQLFAELKMKAHKGREDRVIDPLAHRLGKSSDSIKRLLQRAVQATKTETLDRREAAYLLRQLAVVRRAAVQSQRTPSRRRAEVKPD